MPVGTFFCAKIDLRKAQDRELAKLGESRRAYIADKTEGMPNLMRDENEGAYQRRKGKTPVTMLVQEVAESKNS